MKTLTDENARLKEKLTLLVGCSVTSSALAGKNYKKLKDIAADIKTQRQGLVDFEVYVKWMSANMAGYSKYFAAGSVAAGFAKVLPIPYAGQASVLTKFISNAAVSLSAASVSTNKYLVTSQQFIKRVDALDASKGLNPAEVSELVTFADHELLNGMIDVQEKLNSTAELAASSLAFLESVHHYMGTSEEYWSKTKSLLKSDDKKEKGFLADSIAALKNKAATFNTKFRTFDDTVKKDTPLIKSMLAYDELIREIDPKIVAKK
ncbi:hypothetical protein JFN93_03970 [Geomonas sp. Red875]|uniref:Uncharacterized protein n=1 Tax=Geomesophilobacter sediminis TaxID=2798584 RepID=A0A8J7IWH4_9BACT|nr:hypothetical protein [Geomesophilobacter sediminis]